MKSIFEEVEPPSVKRQKVDDEPASQEIVIEDVDEVIQGLL